MKKPELETSQYVISKHTTEPYNQSNMVLGSEEHSDHWNSIETQEINPHIHRELTQKAKIELNHRKDDICSKWCWEIIHGQNVGI